MLENRSAPQGPKVLVVEDDIALRKLFLRLLERNGYDVDCATDGSQALERLANSDPYAVMLLDLMMPVKSGFDVLRELKEKQPLLLRKTIVTTSASARDLEKIDSSSLFAILRKPFDIDRLLSLVSDCAAQSPALERSARRFESLLPELHELLTAEAGSEQESMVRGELRQRVGEIGGLFAAASELDDTGRLQRVARTANKIAKSSTPRRNH